MAKTYKEKEKILEDTLKKYGLSLDDSEVRVFFFRPRSIYTGRETKDGVDYVRCSFVKPITRTVTPLDFENSGYGVSSDYCLYDWYMYSNGEDNPFVWDNIGNPKFDIKKSFIDQKNNVGILENLDGKLFNSEDGNHRLLTLMINQFMETHSAKSEEELNAITKKYEMSLEVYKPINEKIANLLSTYYYNLMQSESSCIPRLVSNFRRETTSNKREYLCTYNDDTKTFTFSANGKYFEGTENDFQTFLENEIKSIIPFMQWEANGVYYASYQNKIIKSKDKEKIDKISSEFDDSSYSKDTLKSTYAAIKDLDTNTYGIIQGELNIQRNKKNVANVLLEYYEQHEELLVDRLSQHSKWAFNELSLKNLEMMSKYEMPFDLRIDERKYLELSEEDYIKIKKLLDEENNLCFGNEMENF